MDRFLKQREVEAIVGKKRTAIHEDIAAGTFPAPRRIGKASKRWLESEIDEWLRTRPVIVVPPPKPRPQRRPTELHRPSLSE